MSICRRRKIMEGRRKCKKENKRMWWNCKKQGTNAERKWAANPLQICIDDGEEVKSLLQKYELYREGADSCFLEVRSDHKKRVCPGYGLHTSGCKKFLSIGQKKFPGKSMFLCFVLQDQDILQKTIPSWQVQQYDVLYRGYITVL